MNTAPHPLASIGIDIGKEVFHVVGFGTVGKIAFRRKVKRFTLFEAFKELPPCIIGMEACLSAYLASRALRQIGHEARIIPAIYVKPFVKGQKNEAEIGTFRNGYGGTFQALSFGNTSFHSASTPSKCSLHTAQSLAFGSRRPDSRALFLRLSGRQDISVKVLFRSGSM